MRYWVLYSKNNIICKAECPADSEDNYTLQALGYIEVSNVEYDRMEVVPEAPAEPTVWDEMAAAYKEGVQEA